jgi:hypothetical protein
MSRRGVRHRAIFKVDDAIDCRRKFDLMIVEKNDFIPDSPDDFAKTHLNRDFFTCVSW